MITTNAPGRPKFEGQIVKFRSPHFHSVILYDIAVRNERYGHLEWYAMNEPTDAEIAAASWANE